MRASWESSFPSPRGAWGNSTGSAASTTHQNFGTSFRPLAGLGVIQPDEWNVIITAGDAFPSPRGAWGNSTQWQRDDVCEAVLAQFPSPRGAWGNSTRKPTNSMTFSGAGFRPLAGLGVIQLVLRTPNKRAAYARKFPSPRGAWGNSTGKSTQAWYIDPTTFPSPRGAWGNSTRLRGDVLPGNRVSVPSRGLG